MTTGYVTGEVIYRPKAVRRVVAELKRRSAAPGLVPRACPRHVCLWTPWWWSCCGPTQVGGRIPFVRLWFSTASGGLASQVW